MNLKVGDKAIVAVKSPTHYLMVGDEVEIIEIKTYPSGTTTYICKDKDGMIQELTGRQLKEV